ncbi:MAG: lipid-A-disaccharide synthase [Sulfurifustis sp.]
MKSSITPNAAPNRPFATNGGNESPRIGIVAGEVSGDLLGAGLMRELKRRLPNVRFEGIGGPHMQAEGCRSLYEMERLSVIGLEGIAKIPSVWLIRRKVAAYFAAHRPDLYIGVDAPDFNLAVEERLRASRIPTIHYVSPTVWAWRRYRIRSIARAVDRMLTLFPFEADYYREHRVPVTFVGHPLADEIPDRYDPRAIRARIGVPVDGRLVALLPGSRAGELRRHAMLFVRTAQWLHARHPDLHFVAPFASDFTQALFEQALKVARAGQLPIVRLSRRSRDALAAADVVLLASGTATLEAALLKKPMVVTYKVSRLSELLVKTFAHVKMYSLPNLLAGRQLVPEIMQDDATPEALGAAVEQYLDHPEQAESVQAELARMHAALKQGADVRAALAVMEVLMERKLGERAGG